MKISKLLITFLTFCFLCLNANELVQGKPIKKKIVYLVSDINIPFWNIMAKGIEKGTDLLGYDFEILDAQNSAKKELENTIKAIKDEVSGIIVSPTNSSACVTILKLAKEANIPVVISDIGTDGGEYVSYISSNNKNGAYKIGKLLTNKMIEKGFSNKKVGIIAISQKRLNGQERTIGFIKALDESNIVNANLKQLVTWTQEETYNYTKEMLTNYPDLNAIWIQTSSIYKGALKAINESQRKDEILLVTFDAEPEFLNLIPKEIIIASGMQQPYLMGKTALIQLDSHLNGINVKKNLQLPILIISAKNIEKKLPIIKLNVLGIEK
ncbi:MAG: substrate-binding domain-containing protein [Arcobacter sp.]|uniref:substrate-binding domain-containing protein n=1 Tax=Arcobacter sp. TaxID=1872629 RepID=UPI003AFF70C3